MSEGAEPTLQGGHRCVATTPLCRNDYKSLLSLLATFASRLLLSSRLRATIVGLDKKGTRCHYLTLFKCNADGDDNEQVPLFEIVQV